MKRKAIVSLSAVASVKGAKPDWRIHIISPVTFTVSDQIAPSGILAANASEAVASLLYR